MINDKNTISVFISYFLFILYLSSDTNIKSKYLQDELKGTVLYNKNRTKKKDSIKINISGWVHNKNQL